MADENLCLDGTATGSGSSYGNWSGVIGTPLDIKDDNTTSRYGYNGATDSGTCGFNYSCEVIFITATIKKAEIVHDNSAGIGTQTYNWYLDLYYNGSYYQVLSGTGTSTGPFPHTHFQEGNWAAVTKIRLRADGTGGSQGSFLCVMNHYTHELRAWGTRGGGYSCII